LANLFVTLGATSHAAVAPEKRLAYLSLVTATDEDSTLPEETPPIQASNTTSLEPGGISDNDSSMLNIVSAAVNPGTESVLGKRTNEERESAEKSDPENGPHTPSTENNESRLIKAIPGSRSGSRSLSAEPGDPLCQSPTKILPGLVEEESPRQSSGMEVDEDAVALTPSTEIAPLTATRNSVSAAPPLPPRPHRASINNGMMFGKSICDKERGGPILLSCITGRQHDISEALDHVLFQVEAVALTSNSIDQNAANDNVIKR
jgi:hypothetical protein